MVIVCGSLQTLSLWLTVCGLIVQCIGKIGTVHRITDRGDIRVQYDGANNRWTFHAMSLTKVKYVCFAGCVCFYCLIMVSLDQFCHTLFKSFNYRFNEHTEH